MGKKQKNTYKLSIFFMFLGIITLLSGLWLSAPATEAAATKLTATSKTIYVNGTYKITVKNKKAKSTLFYTSHNTKVAKVNKKGTITGINKGTARVTVRYKKSGRYYKVGTFKITVKKATLNTTYKAVSAHVGDKLTATKYLNNINKSATYKITSTKTSVATGNSSGQITATKAGTTTLTIKEVYNKKTRTLGTISMTVTGATMKATSTKMGYDSSIDAFEFLENTENNVEYTFTSNSPALLDANNSILTTCSDLGTTQNCVVTFNEVRGNVTRVIGKLQVTVTNTAFLLPENMKLSIGMGATLSIGGTEGITLTNQNINAEYVLTPSDNNIINDKLVAIKYGTTTVTISEVSPLDGHITTLAEKLTLTVAPAEISPALKANGFTTMINGDEYNQYPIINRNHNVIYRYESADKTICTVSTGGNGDNEDYLVITPLKIGTTTITVSEMDLLNGNKTKRIGLFKVYVNEDTSATPDIDSLTAADLIKAITYTHNNKLYTGNISSTDLSCDFIDINGIGLFDYGTDFASLTEGGFNIVMKKSKYKIVSLATNNGDPYQWLLTVSLGDEQNTTVDVPVTLAAGELDISKIIKQIKLTLGSTAKTISSGTAFPSNPDIFQFADGNVNYELAFTDKQYIAAGATEYDPNAENPVSLSELQNVKCEVTQNKYTATNKSANTSVTGISQPTTVDNANWTFTITFEDETVLDCSLSLGLDN